MAIYERLQHAFKDFLSAANRNRSFLLLPLLFLLIIAAFLLFYLGPATIDRIIYASF